MIMHFLGWLWAFALASLFTVGITLTPITVAWGSIWVYVTFALCLIPGYIIAWLSIVSAVLLVGLAAGVLGIGILGGGAAAASALDKRRGSAAKKRGL